MEQALQTTPSDAGQLAAGAVEPRLGDVGAVLGVDVGVVSRCVV